MSDNQYESYKKELIIYGNGLNVGEGSDPEFLNFTDTFISDIDQETVATHIEKLCKDGGNLSDVSITWFGLGEAIEAPQGKLFNDDKESLKEIYISLFKGLGAADVKSADVFKKIETGILEGSNDKAKVVPIVPSVPNGFSEPVVLDENQLKFIPDTEDYTNGVAADVLLQKLAANMVKDGGNYVVIGSINSNDSDTSNLSGRRADKVRNSLVTYGVPEGNITSIAGGSMAMDKIGMGGSPEANRAVAIVQKDSEEAKAFS
jgi:hypothetical protein